jgi:hypothetical protein
MRFPFSGSVGYPTFRRNIPAGMPPSYPLMWSAGSGGNKFYDPRVYLFDKDTVPYPDVPSATEFCRQVVGSNYTSATSWAPVAPYGSVQRARWNGSIWQAEVNAPYSSLFTCN